MFGIYKGKCYDYVYFRKHYELITEHAEKAFDEFTQRSYLYIKATDENDPGLTDIYDVDICVKYNDSNGQKEEWSLSPDGHLEIFEDRFVEDSGDLKYGNRWIKTIHFKNIEQAWVLYKYIKKDGIVLEKPLIVREDVSIEKLIELRKFYGIWVKL